MTNQDGEETAANLKKISSLSGNGTKKFAQSSNVLEGLPGNLQTSRQSETATIGFSS